MFLMGAGLQSSGFASPRSTLQCPSFTTPRTAASQSSGGTVHNYMDILIIGFFLVQSAVGVYETTWRVGTPVYMLTPAIGTAIFP